MGDDRLLSMIVTGRNDSYMGNFKYRLRTCINLLARNLTRLGRLDDVEVLVTDWGSDVPLSEVLPLTTEAARITRFHYVPPAVAKAARPDGDFYPSCAINTSARRAQGRFCMLFDADSLFPLHSLEGLFRLLDGHYAVPFELDDAFYFFRRHQIPWEVVQREPSLDEWERWLLLNGGPVAVEEAWPGLGGSGAGQMVATRIWHEARGYNQHMVGQGWIDVEFTLRITQRHPYLDLEGVGVTLFHMEHWPRNRRQQWTNRVLNRYVVSGEFHVNRDDWGLRDAPVEVRQSSCVVDAETLGGMRAVSAAGWPSSTVAVVEHVRRTMQTLRIGAPEWEVRCALAWHSLVRHPAKYIELGAAGPSTPVSTVASAQPGVEIYALDQWPSDSSTNSPAHYTRLLRSVGHRGYVRFLSSKAGDTLEHLQRGGVGPSGYDLAYLPVDIPWIRAHAAYVMRHLASGGMAVLKGDRSTVAEVLAALPDREQYRVTLCASGQVTLVHSDASDVAPSRVDFGRPRRLHVGTVVLRLADLVRRVASDPGRVLAWLRSRVRR